MANDFNLLSQSKGTFVLVSSKPLCYESLSRLIDGWICAVCLCLSNKVKQLYCFTKKIICDERDLFSIYFASRCFVVYVYVVQVPLA